MRADDGVRSPSDRPACRGDALRPAGSDHSVSLGQAVADAQQRDKLQKQIDALKKKVDKDNLLQYVEAQDVRKYGLIPEIVGRLPIIMHLDNLDRDALKRILTEPRNAILRQYGKMFELDGIKLEIDPEVLDVIVDTAIKEKLGARGLRSICERIMNDAMYEAPSSRHKTFHLTAAYANKKLGA